MMKTVSMSIVVTLLTFSASIQAALVADQVAFGPGDNVSGGLVLSANHSNLALPT